ncbi:95a70503-920b-41e4-b4f7-81ffce620d85-CDS [Sclerotinia trifoliorum]|uniref:95a70503-920b-41e4-b4f7-81ffce620d85-CDS n=1 Tax=Sclerotinia trifoliorum TaxID=28548 RepID=A0A8H2ZR00_9HELO|nr:95a70503-920b-41e4-b4f7-81ffce620d85-CDS [Sclerotinia trifoliorum]
MRHFQLSKAQEEGRQLHVSGLPRMLDQSENELEIRSIFKNFAIDVVSKSVSPRDNNLDDQRRKFCFVDFTTREEAQAAMKAIDGTIYRDAPLKVSMAIPKSERHGNTYDNRKDGADRNFR